MTNPRFYYFGPLERPGHFMHNEFGHSVLNEEEKSIPWQGFDIDGKLQPGCYLERGYWECRGPQIEGEALIHYKSGWTAISFWDRTIDGRYGCNSTFIAEGIFNFEQMVEMAKTRFAQRWNKMKFQVKLVNP